MLSRSLELTGYACLAAMIALGIGTGCLAQTPPTPQTDCASPLGNKDVAKVETAIGDLAADAARNLLRTDIALIAASELKPKDPPLPAGKILLSDIKPLVSYPDDPLAVLELTGKAVKQALERSVAINPQPNLGFLQVSGLQFTFDLRKPSGERVTSIKVGGSPINEGTTYAVAVTNSVANGALGYWKVWDQDKVKITRKPDATIVKAVEAHFKASPKIDYSKLDRIAPVK